MMDGKAPLSAEIHRRNLGAVFSPDYASPSKVSTPQHNDDTEESYPYTSMYLMLAGQIESGKVPELDDTVVAAEFELKPGQTAEFVLEVGETCGGDAPPPGPAGTPGALARATHSPHRTRWRW